MGTRRRILVGLAAVGLVGTLAIPIAPRAEASGIITHSWMADQAIRYVGDSDLRAILSANEALVESGAHFPDSGYAAGVVGVADDYGEEAHWPRFHNVLADQIAAGCPDVPAPDSGCGRRIAHLFGMVAHGVGDQVWDWLYEPNAPDHGESYVPPELEGQFSNGGLEMQMDLVAIEDYGRRTSPAIPNWPSPPRLHDAFTAVHRSDVSQDDMQKGYSAISVARVGERRLTQNYHDDITRHMPWTSAHLFTAPGGVRFAATAIAAVWANLWGRMQGEELPTSVALTSPASDETDVPWEGWDRDEFLPGSAPGRGGARNRITAVLDASLPYEPFADTPGTIDAQLPPGAMTLSRIEGDDEVPVPIRDGYPRQVPYGPDSGEHLIDIQPDDNLEPCSRYLVRVTDALLDDRGNPVAPWAWSFWTDCPDDPPEHRPDLAAKRRATGALIGDDVYSAGGSGQARFLQARSGSSATFYARIQNDGDEADRFRVTGQGTVFRRFGVNYFDGRTNVTGRVVAGTYRTPVLSPGAARRLRVVINVLPGAPAGSLVTRLVTARSTIDTTRVDGVRLHVRRSPAR